MPKNVFFLALKQIRFLIWNHTYNKQIGTTF